jgi:ADP-heptose:LPS heptosyltransferase
VANLAGTTDLSITADLVGRAGLVITNDSLPLHLAVALSSPCVALFGPTDARSLVPEGAVEVVEGNAPCRPCYANEPAPACRARDCIDSISVDAVCRAARRALRRTAWGAQRADKNRKTRPANTLP